MKYAHLIWRNLTRKKVRTTFTFLSIVVAFFLFGLLMAVRNAFDAGIQIAGQNRLLTIDKVSIIQLIPERYLLHIEQTPGVARATHATWFGGIYKDPKNFFVQMAVVPGPFLDIYPEYVLPAEQREAFERTRTDNLSPEPLKAALKEVERVSRGHSYITVDAGRNEQEQKNLYKWVLTAETMMHVDDWKKLFNEVGYTGDYWWFIAD